MAAQTEVDVASLELEKVRRIVPDLFYWEDTFYSEIPKSKTAEIISNREARIPLKMEPGGKFAHWNPAGGSLGTGSGAKFKHALISIEHLRIAFEYQKLAEYSTNVRRKSVVNAVRNQIKDAMKEFREYCDNLALGDGTGRLADITAVSSGVITCGGENGIKLMRTGQDVQIYAADQITVRTTTRADNTTTVTKYDVQNNQVTLDPVPDSMAATDVVVVAGLNEAGTNLTSKPTSILGVKYHYSNASTGNWLKLNRATYPQIRSTRVNASGNLTLVNIRLAKNKIGDRYGRPSRQKMKAKIWTHVCQMQQYEALGQVAVMIDKQTDREQKLDLYFNQENMVMAGLPVMDHTGWDKSRMDIIDPEIWGRVEMVKPDFYTVEGRRMFERRSSDGAVMASNMFYIVASQNYYIDNPMRAAYVDGLTIPDGY